MILFTFQHFDQFTSSVSALPGRLHGSGCAWLRCNSLEWNNHSPRPASTACSRSSRRAACGASLPAFTLIALMPCSGLQAKLAGVQAGARHAAQACPVPACKHSLHAFKPARGMPRKLALFRPASTACMRSSRRAACRASLPAFTP